MNRKSLVFALGLVATLIAPVSSGAQGTQTPTSRVWQDDVREMLARRAQAVVKGDERTFVATMAAAPERFQEERLTWFERIRSLPLGTYALDFTQDEFAELTLEIHRNSYRDEVHVIQVKERIGIKGYDVVPSSEDVFLTVVKTDDGWNVVADDDAEPLALQSNRNIWDFGPIDHIQAGGIMVIFHPAERAAAQRILTMSRAAQATVKRQWPNRWREDRIIVNIPATVSELARILQTTFDLSTFVAFAASSVDRRTGWDLIGSRVYLHWPNFRKYGESFQRSIMQHEFLHLAARELTNQYMTAIMDEGVAQYYGEAAYNPATPELRAMVRAGRFDRHLADDFIFTAGTPSEIFASYEQANHFIAYVGDRFGRDAGARLYAALAAESAVAPGTWRYHLDVACRSALGIPFAKLERDWARRVIQEMA